MHVVPIPIGADALGYEFDALLLTGGTDPNPRLYSRTDELAAAEQTYDDERDERELSAIRVAVLRGRPVLGLCRGAELLTIHFGGSLRPLDHSVRVLHGARTHREARAPALHEVVLESDSKLARGLGVDRIPDCSSSHSMTLIVPPGSELRVAAYAPDGAVEAVEHAALRAVGVMWHPEDSPDSSVQRELVRIALSPDPGT
jgi:putative glutamine amidotransferase